MIQCQTFQDIVDYDRDTSERNSPVWDCRKDEEGTSDRGGQSHKAGGEEDSCAQIEILKVLSSLCRLSMYFLPEDRGWGP